MKPIGPEVVCFWIAAVLYGIAAVMQIMAIFQKKKNLADLAMNVAWLGLLAHSANFFLPAVRQNYTGICSFDKVVAGTTWMGMVAFIGATLAYKAVRPAATLILPVSFGMMIVGGILPCHPLGPSPVFKGWQLWLHVIGGGFAYGFALLSAVMAVFYMLKAKGKTGYPYDELPDLEVLEGLKDRFFLAAVALSTIMIHFAILWVHMNLPAEFVARAGNSITVLVWSYWMVFAIWLGLRYGLKLKGRKLVWYTPVALILVMVFTFYVAPFREISYHTGPFFPPYDQPEHMKKFLLNPDPKAKPDSTMNQSAPVSSVDKQGNTVAMANVTQR